MNNLKDYILEKFQITKDSKLLRKSNIELKVDIKNSLWEEYEINTIIDSLENNNIPAVCLANYYHNNEEVVYSPTIYIHFDKYWDKHWEEDCMYISKSVDGDYNLGDMKSHTTYPKTKDFSEFIDNIIKVGKTYI